MGSSFGNLKIFTGDFKEIPLKDKSIDITTSSHALEPNGNIINDIITELFRVTKRKLILFEPCYEINSEEGKRRMDRLGYIKNLDHVVNKLGGELNEKIVIKNINNPLNPTVGYVITPPVLSSIFSQEYTNDRELLSVPGTNFSLKEIDNFYYSYETGLCYPILKSIPILKSSSAILASSLSNL